MAAEVVAGAAELDGLVEVATVVGAGATVGELFEVTMGAALDDTLAGFEDEGAGTALDDDGTGAGSALLVLGAGGAGAGLALWPEGRHCL